MFRLFFDRRILVALCLGFLTSLGAWAQSDSEKPSADKTPALGAPVSPAGVKQKPKKQKQDIPLLVNVGFGLSQYQLSELYGDQDGLIFGTELNLSAVAEREVLDRFKDRVPPKFRKAASRLNEVSVSHLLIPKTLYIQPLHDHREAYGVTWGLVPTIMLGWPKFKFVINGGIVLTYLYYRDDRLPEDKQSIHFIRPGLRGGLGIRFPVFTKYLLFEAGVKGDAYIPQTFYNDQDVWNFKGVYGMIHFRFPITVSAAI
ncbi:MAG: hypothetical protein KDD43_01785 [Bdellovibrionales bacterium]|nr:hypothetical protein [Bdellovibrionales bacterium]